ncbi:MAG: hypothetical protein H7837_06800 [Magnetococcus sp. MYC-9]
MITPFDHLTLLIDADHLKLGVKAIARQIHADFSGLPEAEEPVLVVVLKGGGMFGMDLLRAMRRPMPVVFASRNGNFDIGIASADQELLRGRHLIVADALMDSGNTLRLLYQWLQTLQPLSIRLAVLLHKTVSHAEPLVVDYLGYEVPDVRLVGYGLDEKELYRGLPAVYTWWHGTDHAPPLQEEPSGSTRQRKKKRKPEG